MSRRTQRWRWWFTPILGGVVGVAGVVGLGWWLDKVAGHGPAAVQAFVLTAGQLPFQQEVDLQLGEHIDLTLPSGEKMAIWAERWDVRLDHGPSESGLIVRFGMQLGQPYFRPGDPIQNSTMAAKVDGRTYNLHARDYAIDVMGDRLTAPKMRVRIAVRAEKLVTPEDRRQATKQQLQSPDRGERARGLAAARDENWGAELQAMRELVRALTEDTDRSVRDDARQWLMQSGDEATILSKLTPVPPPTYRRGRAGYETGTLATEGTRQGDPPKTKLRDHVLGLLKSDDAGIRAFAVGFFSGYECPSAGEALLAATRDPAPDVRAYALDAARVAGVDPAALVPAILQCLQDPDREVRRQALRMAMRYSGRAPTHAILPLLQDSDLEVRRLAIGALGRPDDPAVVQPLLAATRDPDPTIRGPAAVTLGLAHALEAIDRLVEMLGDGNAHVRWDAANGLRWMRDPRGIAPLRTLLQTEKDQTVRDIAMEAIAEIQLCPPR